MSCRQAEKEKVKRKKEKVAAAVRTFSFFLFTFSFLVLNIADLRNSFEAVEELTCLFAFKQRIASLDAQKKPIAACHLKAVDVEHRVVRLRKSVQREHS